MLDTSLSNYFKNLIKSQVDACNLLETDVESAIDLLSKTFMSNSKILICGNGGSAADSSHIAAEFVNGMNKDIRIPLPAISLAADSSILTSHGNDFSFDTVFSIQVEAIGKPKDTLLAISTSGKSVNVLMAIKMAKSQGLKTILISGLDGSDNKDVDVWVRIPSRDTQTIQEIMLPLEHFICQKVISIVKGKVENNG